MMKPLLLIAPLVLSAEILPAEYPRFFYGEVEVGPERILAFSYSFDDETEVLDWEIIGEESRVVSDRLQVEEGTSLLHRFPFSRQMEVEMTLRRGRAFMVELAANGLSDGTGYQVTLEPGKPHRITVLRAGDDWASHEVDAGSYRTVRVSLRDGRIALALDGEEVFGKEDPSPLGGTRILVTGGARGIQIDEAKVRGEFDPAVVNKVGLERRLPRNRWISLVTSRGLDDFRTGRRGWICLEGIITFKGDKPGDGWATCKDIDPSKMDSYVLEMEAKTENRAWHNRDFDGNVWIAFGVHGRPAGWIFGNHSSELRGVDGTYSTISLSKGQWHAVRVAVKGERAEGFLDGKRAWSLGSAAALGEYEKEEQRRFAFGGTHGPTRFRNVRLMVTD
jgi:hypothetical protein